IVDAVGRARRGASGQMRTDIGRPRLQKASAANERLHRALVIGSEAGSGSERCHAVGRSRRRSAGETERGKKQRDASSHESSCQRGSDRIEGLQLHWTAKSIAAIIKRALPPLLIPALVVILFRKVLRLWWMYDDPFQLRMLRDVALGSLLTTKEF